MIKTRTIGLGLALLAVMAVLTVVVWTGQGQQNPVQAYGPELTATVNDDWTVDLSMSSHSTLSWYYKIGTNGACTVSYYDDTTARAYQSGQQTIKAYTHNLCIYGYLDEATITIPTASLDASQDEWKVDLDLSDGPNPWYFRFGGGGCTEVSGTEVNGISGYQPNTYNIVAYSDSGCANQIATDSVTIPTASLAATRDGWKVDLDLSNGPNPWWFRFGGGGCTKVSGTEVNGISGYQPNTYNIVAYSDSGCGKQIASASVTIPTASLAATRDGWDVDLDLSNGPKPWYYKFNGGGCTEVSGTEVNGISGNTPGTYNVVAYSDSGCGKQIASASVTIPTASLAATVDSNWWLTATLTDGPSQWWATINNRSCRPITGSSHSGRIYEAGTYNVKAYSDSGCSSQIASATGTIAAASLSATVAGDQSVDLALSNGPASWYYRVGSSGSCTSVTGTAANDLTGYAVGSHTVTANLDSYCRYEIASTTFTIAHTHTLEVSVVNGSATLRPVPTYTGDWWYQIDDGSCSKATKRSTSHSVASLSPGSSHTATAYRDSGCVTAMAAKTFVIPSLSATVASDQSVDLALSDFLGSSWWYKDASGSCTAATGTTVNDLTGYAVGTHTATAYGQNNCTYQIATTTFTIAHTHGLDVSVSKGNVYLEPTPEYTANWWYKVDSGSCTLSTLRITTEPITGLAAGSHTATAYRDSGCVTAMATATFYIASLSATVASDQSVDLALSDGPGSWWYKDASDSCTSVTGTAANDLTGYAVGTHTVKAYSDSACIARMASATFTVPPSNLTASNITATTATLTLSYHSGSWWVKETAPSTTGTCVNGRSDYTYSLTGLQSGVSHTYQTYNKAGCDSADEIVSGAFTTLLGTPTIDAAQYRDGGLYVRWNRASGATGLIGYTIECSSSTSAPYTWASPACATHANHTKSILHQRIETDGYQRIRIRATQNGLNSAWVESAVPSGTPPGVPTNLSKSTGNGYVTLDWNKPSGVSGAIGYTVECQDTSGNWAAKGNCGGGTVNSTTANTIRFIRHDFGRPHRVRATHNFLVSAWAYFQ